MRKPRIRALAIRRTHPFEEIRAFVQPILDLMYGTPKRTEMTLWISLALLALGMALSVSDLHAMAVCPITESTL